MNENFFDEENPVTGPYTPEDIEIIKHLRKVKKHHTIEDIPGNGGGVLWKRQQIHVDPLSFVWGR